MSGNGNTDIIPEFGFLFLVSETIFENVVILLKVHPAFLFRGGSLHFK